MRYIWASITKSMKNYGNDIIEHCLKNILNLPEPALFLDALNEPYPSKLDLSQYKFIINPGSTTLYPDNKLFDSAENHPPIICFGGSIFNSGNNYYPEMVAVADKMRKPVGCRDLFTYGILRKQRIPSEFIGCPTLIPQISSAKGDYIAFSFGKNDIAGQIKQLRRIASHNTIVVPIHEVHENIYAETVGVQSVRGAKSLIEAYYNARCVITGRLHGALPAVAAGIPVYFFKDDKSYDSRLTLLEYLSVPIIGICEIKEVEAGRIEYNRSKVTELQCAFTDYVRRFKEEFVI